MPETNAEGAPRESGHRRLLPRLGTPPGGPNAGGHRPGSPEGLDRGDVYRGGFKMPLPPGQFDRPGTAPDARTDAEFREMKTVMMRKASGRAGGDARPHTPQIMTIVEPLATRPDSSSHFGAAPGAPQFAAPGAGLPPASMDGYAPPPGNHGTDFRNAGGRMEGRALKSEKVVVPSTNRGRVNSLLNQAASLDNQALASIGLAGSASEKYIRSKPLQPL